MKLDKSKSYGQIIGSTDGSKFEQNGLVFDQDGNQMNVPAECNCNSDQPKKRGRPAKVVE